MSAGGFAVLLFVVAGLAVAYLVALAASLASVALLRSRKRTRERTALVLALLGCVLICATWLIAFPWLAGVWAYNFTLAAIIFAPVVCGLFTLLCLGVRRLAYRPSRVPRLRYAVAVGRSPPLADNG